MVLLWHVVWKGFSAHLLHGSPGACSVSGLKICELSKTDLLRLLEIENPCEAFLGVDFKTENGLYIVTRKW